LFPFIVRAYATIKRDKKKKKKMADIAIGEYKLTVIRLHDLRRGPQP